ncbi:tetratricopeptide repeat protein [Streptomyces sp. NBC_00582]|uniref:tetratricopeptide repeat protein n=1 Tax=Streptomyces sp. NBC_00582 TaxID=2975783 RepID=UPI0010ECF4FA|nr:tetratricopeptide repeat protein [Streptomyces sp. NBC_00582]WUB60217.1 tetratricopeptide repeat protein [Streptomyces sp. NBC_00582]
MENPQSSHSGDNRAAVAAAHNAKGLDALRQGRHIEAAAIFQDVARRFSALGARLETSAALHNLGLALMRCGNLAQAREIVDEALNLAPGNGETAFDTHEANVRMTAGILARRLNELRAAADHYRRAQELYERHGQLPAALDVRLNMAVLVERSGQLAEAERLLTELRTDILSAGTAHTGDADPVDSAALDNSHRLAAADTTLATLFARHGRYSAAGSLLEEAEAIYRELRLPRELADVLTNQGYVLMQTGRYARALRLMRRAHRMFSDMDMELESARLMCGMAAVERRIGNHAGAAAAYGEALETYERHGLSREVTETRLNLGVVKCDQEEWSEAIDTLFAARAGAIDATELTTASIELNLGVAYAGMKEWDRARACYSTAQRSFEKLKQPLAVADLDMNLGIVDAATENFEDARRRYAKAELSFRELGLWARVARCLHNEGLTWPSDTSERRDRVISAWIALEAARFTFRAPVERTLWREEIGRHAAAAFDAGLMSGTPLLLAEMIERARAIGGLDLAHPGRPELPDADQDDDLSSLPVTFAAVVECAPHSELEPFIRRARHILGVRESASETDTGPGNGIRLSTEVVPVLNVLLP